MQFDETICISESHESKDSKLPIDVHTAAMNAEAEITDSMQTRLDEIQSDSKHAADGINAYETLEGYTKLRVKRAFLCLNEYTIDKRLNDIQQVVSKLQNLIMDKSQLFESTFSIPEDAHIGDMYTPCARDYTLPSV